MPKVNGARVSKLVEREKHIPRSDVIQSHSRVLEACANHLGILGATHIAPSGCRRIIVAPTEADLSAKQRV